MHQDIALPARIPQHRAMFDGGVLSLQRTRGTARVAFDGEARLTKLFQRGSAKVMLPKVHGPHPEAVFLNTAGGLTGGDRLDYTLSVGAGAQVTATTQTAERAYETASGAADVQIRMNVGAGGHLDWLPQETILFDGAGLHRTTRIDLAQGASCLFAEMITLGREAMGETLGRVEFLDRRVITQNGKPVLVDPLRLTGLDLASASPAGRKDARALATLVYVGEDAEDRLPGLRTNLPDTAKASAWDGKLVVRMMSRDPYDLRHSLAALLIHLRGAPVPRVWQI